VLSNRHFKGCFQGVFRAGSVRSLRVSIFEFPFPAFSNRQFGRLEIAFNSHKTKAVRVFRSTQVLAGRARLRAQPSSPRSSTRLLRQPPDFDFRAMYGKLGSLKRVVGALQAACIAAAGAAPPEKRPWIPSTSGISASLRTSTTASRR
jgi:hypothetical protein